MSGAVEKYCTQNDCYKRGARLKSVSYLIVHSPAVYPHIIRVLSGSGGGWFKRWNKPGVEKLVHGFIDDTGVYEFAPPTLACWHIGNSWGNANTLGYELCELDTKAEFEKMWRNAVGHYAALCKKYGLTADKVIGHQEAHKKGIASNHGDPEPYFKRFGKSMNQFRADVKAAMSGQDAGTGSKPTATAGAAKVYAPWAYAKVAGLTKADPTLNVRSGPGTSYGVLRKLANGNEVDVVELYTNGWAKVSIVGQQGYVSADYLTIQERQSAKQTVTVVDCKELNVRRTPNGVSLGTVKAGTVLEVTGSGKDPDGDTWMQIRCGSLAGFVWPKYVR